MGPSQSVNRPAIIPMARAWLDARTDLYIRVEHPIAFGSETGTVATTVGFTYPISPPAQARRLWADSATIRFYNTSDATEVFRLSPSSFGDLSLVPDWFSGSGFEGRRE
jgi:hypothetical protein